MSINDDLQRLLGEQKEITKNYEDILSRLSYDKLVYQNEELKDRVNNYEKNIVELEQKYNELERKYFNLKTLYNQQLLDEKTGILYNSKSKMDIYFKKSSDSNTNKLSQLEGLIKSKIESLKKIIDKEMLEEKILFDKDIDDIYNKLEKSIEEKKKSYDNEEKNIGEFIEKNYANLDNEELSEEAIKKKQRHNDIEMKIGLNILNKLGIIIILIGIITATKYTYSNWFNDYIKVIFIYILGMGFLGIGEVLYRKEKKVFSVGLIGGGAGILYTATFASYFMYSIMDLFPSIIVSVLITTVSLVLSLRYNSKTICGISLLGGYLPFFSYNFLLTSSVSRESVYISMMYLLLLNVLVLVISFKKRWIIINYLSFILNIPSMIMLVALSQNDYISIIYTIIVFVMYVSISLAYPLMNKTKLKILDIILLSLNTIIKSFILYEIFDKNYRGLLALIFVIVYIFLAELVKKKGNGEKRAEAIFYITALTFSVLMIPFQFGMDWAFLGWIIEGTALIYAANKTNDKGMEKAGWIVYLMSLFIFFVDTNRYYSDFKYYYDILYTINTIAQIFILRLYLPKIRAIRFKKSLKSKAIYIYKYYVIIFTLLYFINEIYDNMPHMKDYRQFFIMVITGIVIMLYGYVISKIKILEDRFISIFITILYIIADIIVIGINSYDIAGREPVQIIGIIIIVLYNIVVFFSIKDLLFKLIKRQKLNYQIYPLLLALYVLSSSISFIITQLDLSRINLFISIFIIILALIYLIIGFYKNFVLLRRFGLGLSVFALAKLFLFDLSYLDLMGRIIGYFSFGIILLGMSFIYQKIKSELERERDE